MSIKKIITLVMSLLVLCSVTTSFAKTKKVRKSKAQVTKTVSKKSMKKKPATKKAKKMTKKAVKEEDDMDL